MTREKTKKELRIEELGNKRDAMIKKVIDNLHKGRIENLFWSNKGLTIEEKGSYKSWYHPPQDSNQTREVIMKNIHSIAEVFNPENLDMLEFLMNKIQDGWNWKTESEIEADIQCIKERCGSILMLLSIEAGN